LYDSEAEIPRLPMKSLEGRDASSKRQRAALAIWLSRGLGCELNGRTRETLALLADAPVLRMDFLQAPVMVDSITASLQPVPARLSA